MHSRDILSLSLGLFLFSLAVSIRYVVSPELSLSPILLSQGAGLCILGTLSVRAGWGLPNPGDIRRDRLGLALSGYVLAIILSTMVNGGMAGASRRLAVWLFCPFLYFLATRWPSRVIHYAAVFAVCLYVLAVIGVGAENDALFMASLFGFGLLLLPALGRLGPVLLVINAFIAYKLGSFGGLAAILISLSVYLWRGWWSKLTISVGLIAAMVWISQLPSHASYGDRLVFWREALRLFLSSPLIGRGPGLVYVSDGELYPHAHNFIFTSAAEYGLIGLAFVVWGGWEFFKRVRSAPRWALALVTAYAAWSLIDDPLQFWAPAAILMLGLSRYSVLSQVRA
jgi:O-antigen ligase